MRAPHWRALLILYFLPGLAACQAGEVTVVEPDGSDGGPSLGTLVAQVELRAADSALAGSLGWEAGVPRARVRILRNGTSRWREAETDSQGVATLSGLEPGLYYTFTERVLTESEADGAGATVLGFGTGTLLDIKADTIAHRYQLSPSRQPGLVISEVSGAGPPPWEVPGGGVATNANHFFEIYNSTNATRYLDGLIFGTFPTGLFCHGCANSCALGAPVRTDSTGVYFAGLLSFPGSGSEHPIESGEVKLVAAVAQDHRTVHEDMLDLREADFEIGGAGFADNPEVPNMIVNGTHPFFLNNLATTTKLWFLAKPFDPAAFPVTWRDFQGSGFRKVPLDLIIDVASSVSVWPEDDAEEPPCQPIIHPAIDGFPGGFLNISEVIVRLSLQREILTSEDGIPILMDTNTSAADFSMMHYTPGKLPDRQ